MRYEIIFVDHGGRAFSTTSMEADSDEDAIARAHRTFTGGVGAFYEIRRNGILIHTQAIGRHSPDTSEMAVPFQIVQEQGANRARQYLSQALASTDLGERKRLVTQARAAIVPFVWRAKPESLLTFHVALFRADHTQVVRLDIEADSASQAQRLALILADAWSRECVRFEVSHEQQPVATGRAPFHLPTAELTTWLQAIVIETEIALHDSCRCISESEALLRSLSSWLPNGGIPSA